MGAVSEKRTERLWLSLNAAHDAGEHRHAQRIMAELSERHGFEIVNAVPQSIADGWQFTVEVTGEVPWPSYIRVR